jgi:hypothetical protein
MAECDYADTRYVTKTFARPGLADRPRWQNLSEVRLVCARIYGQMAREVTTPFVLIVEDDIVPPVGVISGLLRCVDAETAMVAAPYRSRLHDGFVVWDDNARRLPEGTGVQDVGGAGFGCALIRREVLADGPFNYGSGLPEDFDHAFCQRLRRERWKIKVNWSFQSVHLDRTRRRDSSQSL